MCVRDVRRWGGDGARVCLMLLLLRRRTCGTLHNNDAAELDHGTSPTSLTICWLDRSSFANNEPLKSWPASNPTMKVVGSSGLNVKAAPPSNVAFCCACCANRTSSCEIWPSPSLSITLKRAAESKKPCVEREREREEGKGGDEGVRGEVRRLLLAACCCCCCCCCR